MKHTIIMASIQTLEIHLDPIWPLGGQLLMSCLNLSIIPHAVEVWTELQLPELRNMCDNHQTPADPLPGDPIQPG